MTKEKTEKIIYTNKKGEVKEYSYTYEYNSPILSPEEGIEHYSALYPGERILFNEEDKVFVSTTIISSVDYVKSQNIIEFIDHHPDSGDIKYCENAVLRLYEVGAVCTIIAEMFKERANELGSMNFNVK